MRRFLACWLLTPGVLGLAVPAAQAGVGAAPVAGVAAPAQELAQAKPPRRAAPATPPTKAKAARKSARGKSVRLAALSAPNLALYPSMVLTEAEAFKALEQELSLKVGKLIHPGDYPAEARRSRWTGTSVVKVQVGTDGMVRNVELQRSSGFEVLDERALAVVRRVSKLFVPFRLRGREHAVTVPVGFYLKEV